MFEQTFRNIDDVLWKEAGCATELDYTEQTSWMLFLKYLDDLEYERAQEAELVGKSYQYIIDEPYRWSAWAAPKTADGAFDHDEALTGADLIAFVNGELFPYLQGFRERATGPDTIEYKIGEIFSEIRNKFASGYSLRDALELIDGLSFRSQKEKHELSHLYEAKIRNMGNAGRNGGEYYTPRPLIRAMIRVVKPRIGERIYDAAAGSAGFLCEAHDYLRYGPDGQGDGSHLSTSDLNTLQTRTFCAKEKKSLPYVIGIMKLILQHFIKYLKAGGRAAIVIKQAQKDAKKLISSGLKPKAEELLATLAEDPSQRPPPFEKLVGDLSGNCSRRINIQHRLTYQVFEEKQVVKVLRLWSPYE